MLVVLQEGVGTAAINAAGFAVLIGSLLLVAVWWAVLYR